MWRTVFRNNKNISLTIQQSQIMISLSQKRSYQLVIFFQGITQKMPGIPQHTNTQNKAKHYFHSLHSRSLFTRKFCIRIGRLWSHPSLICMHRGSTLCLPLAAWISSDGDVKLLKYPAVTECCTSFTDIWGTWLSECHQWWEQIVHNITLSRITEKTKH
jgi:hypothetical protein